MFSTKNARLGRFPEYRGKVAVTVYIEGHLTLNNEIPWLAMAIKAEGRYQSGEGQKLAQ